MRRRYTLQRRAEREAATREQIVRATVDLHARHGVLGTSYAMVARRARVSPQTVYNHFPTLADLLRGCTGHVDRQAPRLDPAQVAAAGPPEARLRRLADDVYAQLAYYAPWLRTSWPEAERVPLLHERFEHNRAQLRELLAAAAGLDSHASRDFLDAAMPLLEYPAFRALTSGRTPERAAGVAGVALVALFHALSHPPAEATP